MKAIALVSTLSETEEGKTMSGTGTVSLASGITDGAEFGLRAEGGDITINANGQNVTRIKKNSSGDIVVKEDTHAVIYVDNAKWYMQGQELSTDTRPYGSSVHKFILGFHDSQNEEVAGKVANIISDMSKLDQGQHVDIDDPVDVNGNVQTGFLLRLHYGDGSSTTQDAEVTISGLSGTSGDLTAVQAGYGMKTNDGLDTRVIFRDPDGQGKNYKISMYSAFDNTVVTDADESLNMNTSMNGSNYAGSTESGDKIERTLAAASGATQSDFNIVSQPNASEEAFVNCIIIEEVV